MHVALDELAMGEITLPAVTAGVEIDDDDDVVVVVVVVVAEEEASTGANEAGDILPSYESANMRSATTPCTIASTSALAVMWSVCTHVA